MKKILEIICCCILAIIMFTAIVIHIVYSSIDNSGLINLNGVILLAIENDDMAPSIVSKDLIFIKEEKLSALYPSNVIAYFSTDSTNKKVVRIARIQEITSIDNIKYKFTLNVDKYADEISSIEGSQVIGKWTGQKISYLGFIMLFLSSQKGFLIGIVFPIIIFFIYELLMFLISFYKRRIKKV